MTTLPLLWNQKFLWFMDLPTQNHRIPFLLKNLKLVMEDFGISDLCSPRIPPLYQIVTSHGGLVCGDYRCVPPRIPSRCQRLWSCGVVAQNGCRNHPRDNDYASIEPCSHVCSSVVTIYGICTYRLHFQKGSRKKQRKNKNAFQ